MCVYISQVNWPPLSRCMTLEYRKTIKPALPVTDHVLSHKFQFLEMRYRMDFSLDVYYAFSLRIQSDLLKNKEN